MLPRPTVRELLLWAVGLRSRHRIVGRSMCPTLEPDEFVLVSKRCLQRGPPPVGSVVLAQHPFEPGLTVIKRVSGWADAERCLLASDNPAEGRDSRHFGPVPRRLLLGLVTSHVRER